MASIEGETADGSGVGDNSATPPLGATALTGRFLPTAIAATRCIYDVIERLRAGLLTQWA
jgi:hypothetical protein